MLVLSGALLVTPVALTQFNKVEWQSVLKGVVAIGMLVGGLYLMSEVLKTSQANLLKGSLAILALKVLHLFPLRLHYKCCLA